MGKRRKLMKPKVVYWLAALIKKNEPEPLRYYVRLTEVQRELIHHRSSYCIYAMGSAGDRAERAFNIASGTCSFGFAGFVEQRGPWSDVVIDLVPPFLNQVLSDGERTGTDH